MSVRVHAAHLRRFESVTALLVGAFLAALAGWAQVRYTSLDDRIAAWRLVREEVRVNLPLLASDHDLDVVTPKEVSPNAAHRYNILIPTMALTRGYDVVTERGLADLSPRDLIAVAAYYTDLNTVNQRIGMLQNFLVYGTLRDTDAQLMPLLMRHYNSIATAATVPLERSGQIAPVIDDIVHRLESKKRRLTDAFLALAGLAAVAFVVVLALGAAELVRDESREKAA